MANIIKRPGWSLPERDVTPENVYQNRRTFIKSLGLAGSGIAAATLAGCSESPAPPIASEQTPSLGREVYDIGYPHPRNEAFNPDWTLTDQTTAATYNNFYEFTTVKDRVHKMVRGFNLSPWEIEIGGNIESPHTIDARELIESMPLEERIYRFRCVEAWAMIVPWTGFPLRKLLDRLELWPEAKFVRFETFGQSKGTPGMSDLSYPWPYFEGLTIEEAMNPLTFVATGIYGKPLPTQHGAPLRLIVPWKYGYKSIKSIVRIEFIEQQPKTFWETLSPIEYPFESNVNPAIPHPRWSQATERMIDTGQRVKTKLYNGYGDYVSELYPIA
jgi:methionine sulfoxide reductase catalytic subunit